MWYTVYLDSLPKQWDFNGLHIIYMDQKAVSDHLLFLWSELQQATDGLTRSHRHVCTRCCELEQLQEEEGFKKGAEEGSDEMNTHRANVSEWIKGLNLGLKTLQDNKRH